MPGIDYTIGAKVAGFTSGINRAFAGARGLTSGLARIAAPLAGVVADFDGVRAAMSGLRGAFDLGGPLSDMSARTGVAVKDLLVLQQAFRDNGVSADAVALNINRMQRALSGVSEDGKETKSAFAALGLDMGKLGDLGAAEQFETIGSAIRGLKDPADRAAAAMAIFGRSGGELLTVFADAGALSKAGQTIGNQAEILERNSGAFDRISDLLQSSGQKLSGFFVGVADKIAPVILPLLEAFNQIDLSGYGQKIGSLFATLAAAFSFGQIRTVVLASLQLAFAESVNFLWRSLRATIAAAGQYLVEYFKTSITYFQILTTADFWKGMGNALIGVFLSAVGYLQNGLAAAMELFRPIAEIFGKDAEFDSAQSLMRASADNADKLAADRFADAGDQLAPAVAKIEQRLADSVGAIAKRFEDTFKATGDVMDTTEMRHELDQAIAEIRAAAAANAAEGGEPTPAETPAPTARAERQVAADRLRQIGGYVGGGLAAAKDKAAEKTEQWTRKTAEATAGLLKHVRRPSTTAATAGATF